MARLTEFYDYMRDKIPNTINGTLIVSSIVAVTAAVVAVGVLVSTFNVDFLARSAIDATNNARLAVDHAHHKIHIGGAYTFETSAAGGAGIKATITFTTADSTEWVHAVIHTRSNVEAIYTLGESPTISADTGTMAPAILRNRNLSNPSLLKGTLRANADSLTEGATVTDFGTILELIHFGNGKQGGETRSDDEWILKQNTTYAMEVESEAANSEIMIEIDWYEHVNAN